MIFPWKICITHANLLYLFSYECPKGYSFHGTDQDSHRIKCQLDGTWTELPNCVRMPVTCKLPPIDNKDVVYEEFNLTQGNKVWMVSMAIVYILKGKEEGTITWLILKASYTELNLYLHTMLEYFNLSVMLLHK